MKNNYFYSVQDIEYLKEIIRTGEPVRQIAARLHVQYETSQQALLQKLYSIKKGTRKIAKWDGPKRIVTKRQSAPSVQETVMPEGFTFEGKPSKVTFCIDHFRVYF
jgi:hypothetical protein